MGLSCIAACLPLLLHLYSAVYPEHIVNKDLAERLFGFHCSNVDLEYYKIKHEFSISMMKNRFNYHM